MAGFAAVSANAQVNLTSAVTFSYSQNFDTLAQANSNNNWTDDSTIASWYAQAVNGFGGDYTGGTGSGNTGDFYSFGTGSSSSERALGSLASVTPGDFAYGVLLRNTSGGPISELQVVYHGEQWRDGGNAPAVAQSLTFSYRFPARPSVA